MHIRKYFLKYPKKGELYEFIDPTQEVQKPYGR